MGHQSPSAISIPPVTIEPVSPSIPKMLRYVEWIFLVMLALLVGLPLLYNPSEFEIQASEGVVIVVGVGLALLSSFFPIHRPVWQRRAYIFVEIFCLLISRAFSEWCLNLFLYLALVKSCFLLRRRDVIFATITAGIAWQISYAWRLSYEMSVPIEERRAAFEASLVYPKHLTILDTIISSSFVYIAASLLVILLCLTVLSERKSRKEAAVLSQEVEVLAADLERTRIAREIHDSLGHTLTTLDMQLEVSQAMYTQNSQSSFQALNQAKRLSEQSLQEIRKAVSTMRHSRFNLSEAIADLIHQIEQTHSQRSHSLKINSAINLPHLPLQTSRQIFLIVKEALTNVQKHSQASVVTLWSENRPENIVIGISDNGIGFQSGIVPKGFGIKGMNERVQLLGGQLEIHSTVGKGTILQFTIPHAVSKTPSEKN
ncbi:MAG: sensor histidine kinase [Phormidesmis sp.]